MTTERRTPPATVLNGLVDNCLYACVGGLTRRPPPTHPPTHPPGPSHPPTTSSNCVDGVFSLAQVDSLLYAYLVGLTSPPLHSASGVALVSRTHTIGLGSTSSYGVDGACGLVDSLLYPCVDGLTSLPHSTSGRGTTSLGNRNCRVGMQTAAATATAAPPAAAEATVISCMSWQQVVRTCHIKGAGLCVVIS